jgi:hypothetical protein
MEVAATFIKSGLPGQNLENLKLGRGRWPPKTCPSPIWFLPPAGLSLRFARDLSPTARI